MPEDETTATHENKIHVEITDMPIETEKFPVENKKVDVELETELPVETNDSSLDTNIEVETEKKE